jgi:hypothetical protein
MEISFEPHLRSEATTGPSGINKRAMTKIVKTIILIFLLLSSGSLQEETKHRLPP